MNRNTLIILCTVGIVFAISSNIAWLNPAPWFTPRWTIFEKIPWMWQYCGNDSRVELEIAANLDFSNNHPRTSRPLYPVLAHFLGYFACLGAGDSEKALLGRAMVGYVVLKLIMFTILGLGVYRICLHYVEPCMALLASLLMLVHSSSLLYAALYHTMELQYITPVIVILLFMDISKAYSLKKNISYSLIVGLLMLGKENYAVYLAVILFCLVHGEWRKVGISVLFQAVPLFLWLGILQLKGWSYYNHGIEHYGQGVWLLSPHGQGVEALKLLQGYAIEFMGLLTAHYGAWLLIAVAALPVLYRERIIGFPEALFFTLFLMTMSLQFLMARRFWPYIVSDMSVIVFGAASYLTVKYLRRVT